MIFNNLCVNPPQPSPQPIELPSVKQSRVNRIVAAYSQAFPGTDGGLNWNQLAESRFIHEFKDDIRVSERQAPRGRIIGLCQLAMDSPVRKPYPESAHNIFEVAHRVNAQAERELGFCYECTVYSGVGACMTTPAFLPTCGASLPVSVALGAFFACTGIVIPGMLGRRYTGTNTNDGSNTNNERQDCAEILRGEYRQYALELMDLYTSPSVEEKNLAKLLAEEIDSDHIEGFLNRANVSNSKQAVSPLRQVIRYIKEHVEPEDADLRRYLRQAILQSHQHLLVTV